MSGYFSDDAEQHQNDDQAERYAQQPQDDRHRHLRFSGTRNIRAMLLLFCKRTGTRDGSLRLLFGPKQIPELHGHSSVLSATFAKRERGGFSETTGMQRTSVRFVGFFVVTGALLLMLLLAVSARLDPSNATSFSEFLSISPAQATSVAQDRAQPSELQPSLFEKLRARALR